MSITSGPIGALVEREIEVLVAERQGAVLGVCTGRRVHADVLDLVQLQCGADWRARWYRPRARARLRLTVLAQSSALARYGRLLLNRCRVAMQACQQASRAAARGLAPCRPQAASAGLVGEAGEALLLAEHLQHFENSRRGRASRQGGAQRLRHRAELDVLAFRRRRARRSPSPPRSMVRPRRGRSSIRRGSRRPRDSAAPWPCRRAGSADRHRESGRSRTVRQAFFARSLRPGIAACELRLEFRREFLRRAPRRWRGAAAAASIASTSSASLDWRM